MAPWALEFIDRLSLEAVNQYLHDSTMPVSEALLLVETDGHDPENVEEESLQLQEICREAGATEIRVSHSSAEREGLWKVRRSLNPAMFAKAPYKTNEDICVPISEVPAMLEEAYRIAARYNVITLCFGHAGDGNLHVNFMSHLEQDPGVDEAVRDLFTTTVRLGGSISGEHGVGITKAPYLHLEMGERERKLLRQVKDLFDPQHILNPGKFIEYC